MFLMRAFEMRFPTGRIFFSLATSFTLDRESYCLHSNWHFSGMVWYGMVWYGMVQGVRGGSVG